MSSGLSLCVPSSPLSCSSAVPLVASLPLTPSSARRSLALLFAQLSTVLAVLYWLGGRIVPFLDWLGELGVDAVKTRPSASLADSKASSVSSGFDVARAPASSTFTSLVGSTPQLAARSLLLSSASSTSASLIQSDVAPSPSARMAALRSRASAVKAVRLVAASPSSSQRSLSQPAHNALPLSQLDLTSPPHKRVAGFTLPSLLSPRLSRSPSVPPSPRSPFFPTSAPISIRQRTGRMATRLLASLHTEEEAVTLAGRVQLSNVLAAAFAVGSLVMFLGMRALVLTSWSSLWLLAATLAPPLLLAAVPLLNHCGHTTVSRVLLVLLVNSGLFLFTCFTPGHGFSTLIYACLPLPLLLFDVSLTSLPFLLSASLPLLFQLLVTLVAYSSLLYTVNSFTSAVILSAVLLHLVTSYQNTHLSLLSASRSSRAAHVAMTSLMHSISHELRTPLNAVCGYAELLLMDDALAASQHDMVKTIADNADALTQLVSDFLTFSSSSSGQLRVDAVILDVEEMLDACLASHALQAHRKGLELVLEVLDDVPALVVGDGQRMREVLSNLISNSIKASAQGCIHIRVSVDQPAAISTSNSFSSSFNLKAGASSSSTVVLRFDVRDEGVGLSAEQQGRLFKPFQAVNPGASSTSSLSSSSFGNSRGLGLAICHSLVQLMGGSIGVVSAPERGQPGSLFYFTVQVHMVDMGEEATATAARNGASGCEAVQLLDAFDGASDERTHTSISPVNEGNESEDDEAAGLHSAGTTPPLSQTSSAAPSCLASPMLVSSSLVRHVLLVSPNRIARDVYARILLQTRGWFVTLCEDEREARLQLFDSPCQSMRRIDGGVSVVSRANSSPTQLEEPHTSLDSGSVYTGHSLRPFDCVVLDQVAGMELASLQRFALNIQSRLDVPCIILRMANASPPSTCRFVSGRADDSHNCTPQSSPHSGGSNARSLLDTTDEAPSAGPLSPASLSYCSSLDATPSLSTSALPAAPFLPRPPSLQAPHYSNVTPPSSHAAKMHSLIQLLAKPVRRKVLVGKVRVLMEQARQRFASKCKRELRARMQHEHDVHAHSQQAMLDADDGAYVHPSFPRIDSSYSLLPAASGADGELGERDQHTTPHAVSFDVAGLPVLPPSAGLSPVLQSCPPVPFNLPALSMPALLTRDASTDSRPSPSMLRSLDRLTAAARSISAPVHAVFMPSRQNSGCSTPIREEEKELHTADSLLQQQSQPECSPFSSASTVSPSSSTDSPPSSTSSSSSSRSSSAASSDDSPLSPRHSQRQYSCHTLHPSQSSPVIPASPPTSLSQLRVLVAEDTVTNQKIIGRMLQRIGVQHATIVNDGKECVQAIMQHTTQGASSSSGQAQQAPYHVILMDLLMPVMDGWQATDCLRSAGYDLPIVALSASAMKSDRIRCDEAGCSAFLSKPTKLADLKDTLERLVLGQR